VIHSTPMTQQLAIDSTNAWRALNEHHASFAGTTIKDLFAADPDRGERFRATAAGIYLDYSKHAFTATTLSLLEQLAAAADLPQQVTALFAGARVNRSEQRAALHPALRGTAPDAVIGGEIEQSRIRMLALARALRSGAVRGATGQVITDVVHLGIGGSDLGPRLVVSAFPELCAVSPRVHFVTSLDSGSLTGVLMRCIPATTMFVLASKSFSTLETLSNARLAQSWLSAGGIAVDGIGTHFVAITSKPERAKAWGIADDRILTLGEWIGGRYSLWSAMGLPVAIALGPDAFTELLAGANAMDQHFRTAPLRTNLPTLHGLLSVWQINFWHQGTRAVLPYVHGLRHLPDYLQQLMMESLGKNVTQDGTAVRFATGAIIWGSEEPNAQHSFHQLLLQGTHTVPADFIVTATPHCEPEQHRWLYANCLAQSRALMVGRERAVLEQELLAAGQPPDVAAFLASHREVQGNRPSNTLVLAAHAPVCLGALLALYEHSVYVQSAIWGINAFDQWGVELGKQVATTIDAALADAADANAYDSSTRALIAHWHNSGDRST
jgi:glucose-6-phosphate isomerase